MSPACERWLVRVGVAISLGKLGSVRSISDSELPMASHSEKSWLVERAMEVARKRHEDTPNERARALTRVFSIAPLEEAANEMDCRLQQKAKAQIVSELRTHGTVFYVVTTHQKPGKDHAKYQGMVVYDPRWVSTPEEMAYIRSHKLISIIAAMKAPYWIFTRSYCRHRFAPLVTSEVLNGTANLAVRDGAHRSMTTVEAYRKKVARRMLIRKRVATKLLRLQR